MPELSIRKARDADLPAVLARLRACAASFKPEPAFDSAARAILEASGRALMDGFEAGARGRGTKLVSVATRRAGPFYERFGYTQSAEYYRKLECASPTGSRAPSAARSGIGGSAASNPPRPKCGPEYYVEGWRESGFSRTAGARSDELL